MAMPARGAGAAAPRPHGMCREPAYAGLRRTRRGRATRTGTRVERVKGVGQRRRAALGWYRPSVGVPEERRSAGSCGVLRLTIFSSVQARRPPGGVFK
eukprot:scaffold13243_cov72-Phaeocystis_antarctica.AAC.2